MTFTHLYTGIQGSTRASPHIPPSLFSQQPCEVGNAITSSEVQVWSKGKFEAPKGAGMGTFLAALYNYENTT